MSLEQIIERNTAAIEKQNTLLEQLLAKTGTTPASAPAVAEDKPAAEDKPKSNKANKVAADKPAADADAATVTVESLDAKFRPWLGEFPKEHPETAARRAKFADLLKKLGEKKMSEITDATKLGKLDNWFDTKAKTWDEGHGVGRFAADPEVAEADEPAGDDDL